jgi:hypothetical protein
MTDLKTDTLHFIVASAGDRRVLVGHATTEEDAVKIAKERANGRHMQIEQRSAAHTELAIEVWPDDPVPVLDLGGAPRG